jgi:hypothetical protein
MEEVFTFSRNQWISVKVPLSVQGQELYYAFLWAKLVHEKGVSEQKASIIAEATVFKRLYPGLVYGEKLESEIKSL